MPTSTDQPSRKERNQHRLLDEGVRIMMLQGYHGTGIKELVDTVGVPKGSFYQYFKSKEVFGAATIHHYIEPFIVRLRRTLEATPHDALGALHSYFAELTVEAEQNNYEGGCLLGNLLGEIGDHEGACFTALKQSVDDYCVQFEQVLLKAQQQGTVTNACSASDLALVLFSSWQGALLTMKVERSTTPLTRTITILLDHSFRP